MALGHVAEGDPHAAAHNAERDAINDVPDMLITLLDDPDSALRAKLDEIYGSGGAPSFARFADLEDVDVSAASAGKTIAYDDASSLWIASDPVDSNIVDVTPWQPYPLLASSNFDQGLTGVATSGDTSTVTQGLVDMSSITGLGVNPAYNKAYRVDIAGNARTVRVSLDPSLFTGLGGKTLAFVKYWLAVDVANSNGHYTFFEDGATQREATTRSVDFPWTKMQQTLDTPLHTLTFGTGSAGASGGVTSYITGFEIYGAAALYQINQFVRYNGQFWRSLQNDNLYQPGVQGWELVS